MAQSANDSRANTSHQGEVDVSTTQLVVEDEVKPHRFGERREAASVDVSNHPTPTTLIANSTNKLAGCAGTSGTSKRFARSSIGVKPTKKSPEVFTIDGTFWENFKVDDACAGRVVG